MNDTVAKAVPGKYEDSITISSFKNGIGETLYHVAYQEFKEPKTLWLNYFDTEAKVIAYVRRYMFKHQEERRFLDNPV